jgi:hypothetical protein
MDAVSLIRSALDEQKLAWLQESGATTQLWRASMVLARALEENFLHIKANATQQLDPRIVDQWRRRYEAGLHRLQQARVPTTRDPREGFEIYRSLRSEWDVHIAVLAPAMAYDLAEIDPVGAEPERAERRAPFQARRHAAG